MGEALLINNTAGSPTGLAATDTDLITGKLRANQYKSVRISGTVQIAPNASAVARTITLKIKLGSTTIASFTVLTQAGATVGATTFNQNIEYITNSAAANDSVGAGGTLSIAAVGSAADATNTILTGKNLYVISVE